MYGVHNGAPRLGNWLRIILFRRRQKWESLASGYRKGGSGSALVRLFNRQKGKLEEAFSCTNCSLRRLAPFLNGASKTCDSLILICGGAWTKVLFRFADYSFSIYFFFNNRSRCVLCNYRTHLWNVKQSDVRMMGLCFTSMRTPNRENVHCCYHRIEFTWLNSGLFGVFTRIRDSILRLLTFRKNYTGKREGGCRARHKD